MALSPTARKWLIFTIFFVAGGFNVVLTNVLYNTQGDGLHDSPAQFRKPFFQTWGMFLAVSLAIFRTPTVRNCHCTEYIPTKKLAGWGLFRMLSLPGMCDLMSSILSNTALLHLIPSSWQALRSSVFLFVSLLTILYRHRKPIVVELIGILLSALGVLIVAVSTVLEQTHSLNQTAREVWLGVLLVLLSQIIQSIQILIENEFVHDIAADPAEVSSFAGLWGLCVSTLILLPLANILPSSAGEGLYESSLESFHMLFSSAKIGLVFLAYLVAALLYSQAGIAITEMSSALHRALYEIVRTVPSWAISLIARAIATDGTAGEKVSWYSLL
jgi:hypothetical protein